MLPLKWKLYRIINYLLLFSGAIISLSFIRLIVRPTDKLYLLVTSLFSLAFFFVATQAFINLAIMVKTFPDKLLSRNKSRWHALALFLNVISCSGLIFAFFSLISEIYRSDPFDRAGLLIMFLIISVLIVLLLYIFYCQLSLKKYLKLKNTVLINSLIDSIGENE